jgi:hypothetical protein
MGLQASVFGHPPAVRLLSFCLSEYRQALAIRAVRLS